MLSGLNEEQFVLVDLENNMCEADPIHIGTYKDLREQVSDEDVFCEAANNAIFNFNEQVLITQLDLWLRESGNTWGPYFIDSETACHSMIDRQECAVLYRIHLPKGTLRRKNFA